MKTLGMILATAGLVWFIARNPASAPIAPVTPAPAPVVVYVQAATPAPRPERVWSQMPDGHWVQHDRGVSAMQSLGLGGGGGGPIPTPKPVGGDAVRDQWGWKSKGALDKR